MLKWNLQMESAVEFDIQRWDTETEAEKWICFSDGEWEMWDFLESKEEKKKSGECPLNQKVFYIYSVVFFLFSFFLFFFVSLFLRQINWIWILD